MQFNDFYETRTATEAEAHAEWHLNAGVPMGTPGCPWDACHDDDWHDDEPDPDECLMCGGLLLSLGTLGRLDWFRCRDCGMDQSRGVSA